MIFNQEKEYKEKFRILYKNNKIVEVSKEEYFTIIPTGFTENSKEPACSEITIEKENDQFYLVQTYISDKDLRE